MLSKCYQTVVHNIFGDRDIPETAKKLLALFIIVFSLNATHTRSIHIDNADYSILASVNRITLFGRDQSISKTFSLWVHAFVFDPHVEWVLFNLIDDIL